MKQTNSLTNALNSMDHEAIKTTLLNDYIIETGNLMVLKRKILVPTLFLVHKNKSHCHEIYPGSVCGYPQISPALDININDNDFVSFTYYDERLMTESRALPLLSFATDTTSLEMEQMNTWFNATLVERFHTYLKNESIKNFIKNDFEKKFSHFLESIDYLDKADKSFEELVLLTQSFVLSSSLNQEVENSAFQLSANNDCEGITLQAIEMELLSKTDELFVGEKLQEMKINMPISVMQNIIKRLSRASIIDKEDDYKIEAQERYSLKNSFSYRGAGNWPVEQSPDLSAHEKFKLLKDIKIANDKHWKFLTKLDPLLSI